MSDCVTCRANKAHSHSGGHCTCCGKSHHTPEVGDNATAVAVSPGLSGLTSFIDAVLAPAPEAEHEPAPPPATKGSPRSRLRELQAEITKELAANNEAFGTKDWQDQLLTVLESRDYWKDQYERYRRKYEALRAKYVFVVERHNSLVTANLRTRDQLQDLERELFKSVLPDGLQASMDETDEARVRDYVLDDMRAIPEEDEQPNEQ